jgi:hypothetical protein
LNSTGSRSIADRGTSLKRESSGLPPLSDDIFFRADGNEDLRFQGTATTGANSGVSSLSGHPKASDYDPEKTPAWNPRPEGLAYYGIRLDNVEFEEQNLFERFKPIFDYEDKTPNVVDKKKGAFYDTSEEDAANATFHVTRGKVHGEMEQTEDILLV